MKTSLKTISLLASAALFTLNSLSAVETVPVGYSTWNIAAGTGTARTFTTLSLPLYQPSNSTDGVSSGVITGLTSSTLTVSGANWTAGELSQAGSPFCLRITREGAAAEGWTLLVSTSSPNTSDTLTVDLASSGVSDLAALGIEVGTDTFELIECDTLSSLFGEPTEGGIVGGDYASADNVWLFVGGSWRKFYYNDTLSRWTRFFPGNPDASNQVVLPDSGILYSRLAATSSELVISGTVPSTDRIVSINQSGLSVIGSSWPVDVTLAQSNISSIPEWVSSSDFNVADIVWVLNAGSWRKYYHDGTDWRRRFPGTPVANDVVIESGSAVLIQKTAASTSNSALSQALPYTL